MKRFLCLLMILFTLTALCACQKSEEPTYTFYYLRTEETIEYGTEHALIAPVAQTISGRNADLKYLLRMYVEGAIPEEYTSPYPSGTRVLDVRTEGEMLIMELSSEFTQLQDIHLSLALACLNATCQDLTACSALRIQSGDQTYITQSSNYTLLDDTVSTE